MVFLVEESTFIKFGESSPSYTSQTYGVISVFWFTVNILNYLFPKFFVFFDTIKYKYTLILTREALLNEQKHIAILIVPFYRNTNFT